MPQNLQKIINILQVHDNAKERKQPRNHTHTHTQTNKQTNTHTHTHTYALRNNINMKIVIVLSWCYHAEASVVWYGWMLQRGSCSECAEECEGVL